MDKKIHNVFICSLTVAKCYLNSLSCSKKKFITFYMSVLFRWRASKSTKAVRL